MKKLVKKRHSVRKFIKSNVSIDDIQESIDLAQEAPSAGGVKAYDYLVVGGEQVEEVARIAKQKWISEASVVIVICAWPGKSMARYGERGRDLYCFQDATLFGAYLDLLLVEKGYGTCWVGAFNEREARDLLKIPMRLRPISLLVVGLPSNSFTK